MEMLRSKFPATEESLWAGDLDHLKLSFNLFEHREWVLLSTQALELEFLAYIVHEESYKQVGFGFELSFFRT